MPAPAAHYFPESLCPRRSLTYDSGVVWPSRTACSSGPTQTWILSSSWKRCGVLTCVDSYASGWTAVLQP